MIALIGFSVTAQKRGMKKQQKQMHHLEAFSAEEIAQLNTKKLTLILDLTEAQQQKIQALELEKATKRKEKAKALKDKKQNEERVKPTKEERLVMMNNRLDRQIAEKATMKVLLNDLQFSKWETLKLDTHSKSRRKKRHSKKHKR
jgi:hypothetical protein